MKSLKISQSITDRQDASLSIFFKEVSKIPMADIDEEIALSKRIKNGDTSAINRLVEANLRFIISVAKQYQNKGLPLVDLIQAGTEGAIKACKLWDASRGFKFISYAVWWIRQSITQALTSECRTIRIPTSQIVLMNKINKAITKFEQENSRKPTSEELSSITGISVDKIDLNLVSVGKPTSLDTPFKDEEDASSLLDVIPNDNTDINNSLTQETVSKEIKEVLSKLSNREHDVILMIFGLGMNPMTYEEIGARFGITSERVRQVQNEALTKIRMKYKDDLRELL